MCGGPGERLRPVLGAVHDVSGTIEIPGDDLGDGRIVVHDEDAHRVPGPAQDGYGGWGFVRLLHVVQRPTDRASYPFSCLDVRVS